MVTYTFFFILACIFQIFCNKHLGVGQSVTLLRNGRIFLKSIIQNKARKVAYNTGNVTYGNIINYPIIFYALKFMPKRRQKTKDILARKKNSSLTSDCLTITNNLNKHWHIKVSCAYSITQG